MDWFDVLFKVLGWVVAPILTYIIGRLTSRITKMQEQKVKEEETAQNEMWAIKETCKYMLKKSFKEDYDYYHELGYCPIEEKNDIEKAYKLYKEIFDGNGVGTRYVSSILDLPDYPSDSSKK